MLVLLFVLFSLQVSTITPENADQLQEIQRIELSEDFANILAFHPQDDDLLYMGLQSGQVLVADVADMSQRAWQAHTEPVTDIAITTNGEQLISASEDGCVFVWDISSANKTQQIGDCDHPVIAVSLNASDDLLAVAYENGQVQLYDLETGAFITRFYTRGAPVNVAFFRRTGESEVDRLVIADLGTIWIYSIDDEIIMLSDFVRVGYVQSVTDMGLNPITIFNLPDVAVVMTQTHPQIWSFWGLTPHSYVFEQSEMTYGHALDFDANGQLFAVAGKFTVAGGGCNVVHCVEIFYTGEEDEPHRHVFGDRLIVLDVLDGHSVWHTDVQFSPSSRYLASASRDGLVIVWGIP